MDTELAKGLTFLAWTGAGFLIVIGVFTAKLLFDLSRLTISIKKSSDIVQNELEPIMKNVGAAASTINNIVQTTNKKVGKLTEIYDNVSDIVINTVKKVTTVSGYALKEIAKGIFAGFKAVINRK